MYRLASGIKKDPQKRWALPDHGFFACESCHILAFAFLERLSSSGFTSPGPDSQATISY
jgi:hypothetical protein